MSVAATGRRLAESGLTYEDVAEGDWFETPAETVTVAMIDAFADLTGDRFEIHMTDEAARRHGFPARVAHGLLVLSLVDGLKNRATARFSAVASLGWTWRFSGPVLAGDRIRARITVAGGRATRNEGRAILTLHFTVLTAPGVEVQQGENQLMVYRRGAVP